MVPVCPKCDVGLFIVRFKTVEVDFCYQCRGLWLDAGELESLMDQTGATAADPLLASLANAPAEQRTRCLCPRCDQRLEEFRVGAELLLDRCPRGHGLWFDTQELRRLLAQCQDAGPTISFLNELFGNTTKEEVTC